MQIISNRQFYIILLIFITSTADIYLPSITVALAGRDAWLSVIASALAGSFIVFILGALTKKYPGKSLAEYAPLLLGPVAGNLLISIYLFFLLYITLAIMGELGQIINSVFLTRTPMIVIFLVITLAAGYAVWLGFEVLARLVELAFPLGILIRIMIILFALSDVQILRYLPVLEYGTGPVFQGALRITGWMGETVIVLFLSQHLKSPARITATLLAVIWSTALLLLLGYSSIGTFGPRAAGDITFPLLEMIRILKFGGAQGLEALVMVFWYSATFIKISVLYYILISTFRNWVKARAFSKLLVPLGLSLVILPTVLFAEVSPTLEFLRYIWPGFALTFELLLPAGLLALSFLRKAKIREAGVK